MIVNIGNHNIGVIFGMADSTINKLLESLKNDRDELRLHIHLAAMETQDEWHKLEKQWHELEPKISSFTDEAKSSAQDVGNATVDVAKELGKAYHRLKKRLEQ